MSYQYNRENAERYRIAIALNVDHDSGFMDTLTQNDLIDLIAGLGSLIERSRAYYSFKGDFYPMDLAEYTAQELSAGKISRKNRHDFITRAAYNHWLAFNSKKTTHYIIKDDEGDFWNQDDGWTEFDDCATRYSVMDIDQELVRLPIGGVFHKIEGT